MSSPKQLHLDIKLDDSIHLSKFIFCDSTKFLITSLEDFINDNPLSHFIYLWGNEGVGKNYLLRAVNQGHLEREKNTAFLTFSYSKKISPDMFMGLEKLHAVFLENVHLLPQSYEWEEAFFNLVEGCMKENCKLFLTADRVAKLLKINLPDLKSRLLAFTALEVPEIKEEEKASALKEAALRRGIDLGSKEVRYILTHTSRSLSDLLRLLSDLDSFSLEKQRKLTIVLIKELLATRDNSPNT